MNPVAITHLIVGALAIALSVPLIREKVKMNHWYGVRIPAAFESDEAWFEINHYGGRLLLIWGVVIVATAAVGASLGKRDWLSYDWISPVVILGGLLVVVAMIFWHAGKSKRS